MQNAATTTTTDDTTTEVFDLRTAATEEGSASDEADAARGGSEADAEPAIDEETES